MAYSRGLLNPQKGQGDAQFKQMVSQNTKKFLAPKGDINVEHLLETITPRSNVKSKKIKRYFKKRKQNLRDKLSGNPVPNLRDQDIKNQLAAIEFWRSQGVEDAAESEVNNEFARDFYAWLNGQGKETDHEKTPWDRQRIPDPEVQAYLRSFTDARYEFAEALENLVFKASPGSRGLEGLPEHYLYFKYIVRGEWQHSDSEFLHDYDRLIRPNTLEMKEPNSHDLRLKDPVRSMNEIMSHEKYVGKPDQWGYYRGVDDTEKINVLVNHKKIGWWAEGLGNRDSISSSEDTDVEDAKDANYAPKKKDSYDSSEEEYAKARKGKEKDKEPKEKTPDYGPQLLQMTKLLAQNNLQNHRAKQADENFQAETLRILELLRACCDQKLGLTREAVEIAKTRPEGVNHDALAAQIGQAMMAQNDALTGNFERALGKLGEDLGGLYTKLENQGTSLLERVMNMQQNQVAPAPNPEFAELMVHVQASVAASNRAVDFMNAERGTLLELLDRANKNVLNSEKDLRELKSWSDDQAGPILEQLHASNIEANARIKQRNAQKSEFERGLLEDYRQRTQLVEDQVAMMFGTIQGLLNNAEQQRELLAAQAPPPENDVEIESKTNKKGGSSSSSSSSNSSSSSSDQEVKTALTLFGNISTRETTSLTESKSQTALKELLEGLTPEQFALYEKGKKNKQLKVMRAVSEAEKKEEEAAEKKRKDEEEERVKKEKKEADEAEKKRKREEEEAAKKEKKEREAEEKKKKDEEEARVKREKKLEAEKKKKKEEEEQRLKKENKAKEAEKAKAEKEKRTAEKEKKKAEEETKRKEEKAETDRLKKELEEDRKKLEEYHANWQDAEKRRKKLLEELEKKRHEEEGVITTSSGSESSSKKRRRRKSDKKG
jgi:DNA repair exonuclease SbcCD ATPase subunit